MKKALALLLTASLVTLAFAVSSGAAPDRVAMKFSAHPIPRVECAAPRTLRLHRFEDGSARLECHARTLVRISVPG